MGIGSIRVLFVLLSAVVGHQIGSVIFGFHSQYGLYGVGVGTIVALAVIGLEKMSDRVSLSGLSAAVFGIIMALIMANLISAAINTIEMDESWRSSIKLVLVLVLAYLGVVFSIRGKDEFNVIIPYVKFKRQDQFDMPVILDTSAIIDGRIADLIETRFLEGHFVVPKFVLKELQQVADSADTLKRNRGRQGLEVLNQLKKNPKFNFKIHNEDFAEHTEVDQKLIKLAQLLDGKLLTTDFNLNKVAEFHDVTVLNINDLANALKPVVIPGETLEVQPVKEGREPDQVVAYLNDGTMVVVDGSRECIGQTLRVQVTSSIQRPAGRMIFAKMEKVK